MLKVLCVDDDDDIREIALMSLELDPAFDVRCCSSGQEAVALVEEWQPDLVLLDVMMPGMDGPATLAAIKQLELEKHPQVIFCTARYQQRDVDSYVALGATAVISKPFDPMTLASTVRELAR